MPLLLAEHQDGPHGRRGVDDSGSGESAEGGKDRGGSAGSVEEAWREVSGLGLGDADGEAMNDTRRAPVQVLSGRGVHDEPLSRKRMGKSMRERVEGSWEDVPNDMEESGESVDEDETLDILPPSARIDTSLAGPVDGEDSKEDEEGMWEDEADYNSEDDTSALESVTEYEYGEEEEEMGAESGTRPRAGMSYREALRQYRASRRALLLSGLAAYGGREDPERLMTSSKRRGASKTPADGGSSRLGHEHEHGHRESDAEAYEDEEEEQGEDSMDRYGLGDADAASAESIEAADPVWRAHEVHLNPPSAAQMLHPRSPRHAFSATRHGADGIGGAAGGNGVDARKEFAPSALSAFVKEAYASEPVTPVAEHPPKVDYGFLALGPGGEDVHEDDVRDLDPRNGVEFGRPGIQSLVERSDSPADSPTTEPRTPASQAKQTANSRGQAHAQQNAHGNVQTQAPQANDGLLSSLSLSRIARLSSALASVVHGPLADSGGASFGFTRLPKSSDGSSGSSNGPDAQGTDKGMGAGAAAGAGAGANVPTEPESLAGHGPFSLWDYLREEILATDFDSTQELKWERVTNFIAIPFWMEKVGKASPTKCKDVRMLMISSLSRSQIILFGFVVCLDSFLYTFTILPLRFLVAIWRWGSNCAVWAVGGEKRFLHSSHKCDMLKGLLIVLSCVILHRITDASKMYHSVRGQDVVKLYVIFNVLEIADRLCCSFGQDLLDSLFSRITLARRKDGRQPYLRPAGFFVLSLAYVLAHTVVLFYQLVTLNVAINSYDNALLTLLLSNQFVEIKGSVFKKFEKENLFQLTCADIVERFQLTLMLSAIGLRNLIEVTGGSAGGADAAAAGPLPTSFTVFPSLSLLETIFAPVCIVLASECVVDWLKHAFITKFNHIRPAVYGRFMDVLCRDLVVAGPGAAGKARRHTFVDQSPVVSRRLGFAALPLACLLVRITSQVVGMLGDTSHFDECAIPDAHRFRGGLGIARTAARAGLHIDTNGATHRALEVLVQGFAWGLTIVIAWALCVFRFALSLCLVVHPADFLSRCFASLSVSAQPRSSQTSTRHEPSQFRIPPLRNETSKRARRRTQCAGSTSHRSRQRRAGTCHPLSLSNHSHLEPLTDCQGSFLTANISHILHLFSYPSCPLLVPMPIQAYDAKVAQLLDKREDDATRVGLSGQQLPAPPRSKDKSGNSSGAGVGGAGGGGGGKPKVDSLMDLSRYQMVRSRIW